jgi:outer membrane protein assembly factor BamD (BamD/ComL family)
MPHGYDPPVRTALLPFLIALIVAARPSGAQTEFTLDDFDQWKPTPGPAPLEPILQQAQLALANGEPQRAYTLAETFLDQNPLSSQRADALLIKGDAELAQDNEWQALFAYEEIARRHATTTAFVPALEREFEIARAYTHGLRKRFLGTFRLLDAGDDGQEILIRIQERLPGSELAEKAGMELADYYFRIRDMPLAADAYDLFTQNYPHSRQLVKARLRLIYAYYAQFKGPEFEGKGLQEATASLKRLQDDEPAVAQKIGADALLVRIYESEAARLKAQSDWYVRVNDWIAAELMVRTLVRKYPNSIAAIAALREINPILEKLPRSILKDCPDYAALRKAIVGIDGPTDPPGIAPAPEAPLPTTAPETPAAPVPGAIPAPDGNPPPAGAKP